MTEIDFSSLHRSSRAATLGPLPEPIVEQDPQNAMVRFRELMQDFYQLIQNNRREFTLAADQTIETYKEKTQDVKELKEGQALNLLELSCLASALLAISPFMPHINDAGYQSVFDSLGGVDAVKRVFESCSQFAEGAKPVVNNWKEGKAVEEAMTKELLQSTFPALQEAARQDRGTVERLMNAANEAIHEYHKARGAH